jgi:hypothetical protein
MNIKTSTDEVVWAAGNFTAHLNADLMPYQESSVALIAAAQRQLVNGYNYFVAVVVREEMVFDATRKRHGWPDTTLHWATMWHPGAWIKDQHWQLVKDEVPAKTVVVDPKADHTAAMIHHYDELAVAHVNDLLRLDHEGEAAFRDVEQELVAFLRADIQTLHFPHMVESGDNVTVLDPYSISLVHAVCLTKCKSCEEGKEDEHIAVAVISKDNAGTETVLSVFSEVMYNRDKKKPGDNGSEVDSGGQCDRRGMNGGGVFAIVFFVSAAAAGVAYHLGNKNGKNAMGSYGHSHNGPQDWDSSVDESIGGGMDMRPLEGVVAKAEDVDMDL